MAKYIWYCAICWQQFDHIKEHNTGSWVGLERIDGVCKGDIRQCRDTIKNPSTSAVPGSFDFDSSEAITIK